MLSLYMSSTNHSQISEIRLKPKSALETWEIPVKLKFHTARDIQILPVNILEKNAREIFAIALFKFVKRVPVNVKSARKYFEKNKFNAE